MSSLLNPVWYIEFSSSSIKKSYIMFSNSYRPRPEVEFPWGSMSTIRVFLPLRANAELKFMTVVLFPTPPFWLKTVITTDIFLPHFYIINNIMFLYYFKDKQKNKLQKFFEAYALRRALLFLFSFLFLCSTWSIFYFLFYFSLKWWFSRLSSSSRIFFVCGFYFFIKII